KVGDDLENLKFNTAISAMMVFLNEMEKNQISKKDFEKFLVILSPFAPHISEELWEKLGHKESIFVQEWPQFDPELIKEENIELIVQVNGKLRDKIQVSTGISEEDAKKAALESEKVKAFLEDKEPKKVIFVKGKLINIVI
ncbi:MAG: class I tRNA ligase family protein, partial [Candidatus Portnoybacteria bacterium]|nr:class I tRNA ligase family protein [Candidatus Portnoybacteria bacterium]